VAPFPPLLGFYAQGDAAMQISWLNAIGETPANGDLEL
jgi:hypothetical protein